MEDVVSYYQVEDTGDRLAGAITEGGFGSVPILAKDGKVLGIVSEYDLLKAIMEGKELSKVTAEDIMTFFGHELSRLGVHLARCVHLPDERAAFLGELRRSAAEADLVVVTGSQSNVRAGYSSGTPALGVGTGNVEVIVDDSADCADAARKIMASKTFDNATSCSSENAIIIHDKVYERMMAALAKEGGALLAADEKATLQKAMFPGGKLSPAVTAQSVKTICGVAGLARAGLAEANGHVDHRHADRVSRSASSAPGSPSAR